MENIIIKATKQRKENGNSYLEFPKKEYLGYLNSLENGAEVIIEIYQKRTLPQNRLLHKLISLYSGHTGEPFDVSKAYLVCKFFGCVDAMIEGEHYKVPISTSTLKKEDFTNGLQAMMVFFESELQINLDKLN
jgi:hypothetical protein